MLRNLKEIHRSAEDWPRALAVLEAHSAAAAAGLGGATRPRPGYAELGMNGAAAGDLAAYLEHAVEAAGPARHLGARLTELRRQGSPRLLTGASAGRRREGRPGRAPA